MSRSFKKQIKAISLFVLLGTGCAHNPMNSVNARPEFFRDSAADVTNRAPDSLSVPQDAATGSQIDALQMRSQADYHFTLAETQSLDGNSQRAIEEYKLTLIYDPNSTIVRLRLAQEFVRQGLITEAMEQAKLALETNPKLVEAHMLLGGLYSALRMYAEALETYRAVEKLDPANLEAPMFIGALYAEQKKYPEALAQFDALARNKDNQAPHLAWYYSGRIHLELNKPDARAKAETCFNKAIAEKPEFVDAVLALGQLYELEGKRVQAKNLYARYQETRGPDAGVAEALSKIYMEDEDWDQALDQLEVVEARNEDDLNVKVRVAFIYIEKKRYPEAIVKLQDILTRAPDSDKIRFYLGAVFEETKEYKGAIAQFNKIPAGSQYHTEAVVHSAYLNKMAGDYEEAVRVVEKGIQEEPDHPQFYALYASFLDEMKKWDRGVTMLSAAIKKFPENAQLYFFLGSMEDHLGKTDQTVADMKHVLELEPDHVQALNYLAYTFADKNIDLDEAERLARRALNLQANDGYILDTLGWVLFKKGETAEAVRTLEAAYKVQPGESIIAEHLGDAYYRQQLPEKAKRMYQKAMESETDQGTVRKIQNKLVSVEKQQEQIGLVKHDRMPASESSH
jgi:tetratricopeptide (TPR) repeat protein